MNLCATRCATSRKTCVRNSVRNRFGTFLKHTMKNLTLKLSPPKANNKGKRRVNVYLRDKVAISAVSVASDRYGYSRSELVDRLLEEEIRSKKGLLFGLDHHSSGWRERRRAM